MKPGPVTYHRTDSPNLSQEAIEAIRALAEEKGWPLPDVHRVWKAKEGAQEAHEAIRATHAEKESAGENEEERSLYALIRLRALASQLADAVYAVRVLRLSADLDGREAIFEARGRTLMTEGWKVLLHADQANEGETEAENPVPSMKPGGKVLALSGTVLTKKTKPAPRYTEAALTPGTGKARHWPSLNLCRHFGHHSQTGLCGNGKKRFLVPTPLGEKVIEALAGKFSFSDYGFTRDMEQALDDIASGKGEYKAVVSHAHEQLQKELAAFLKATGKVCPKCGRAMVRRVKPGKGGYDFLGLFRVS